VTLLFWVGIHECNELIMSLDFLETLYWGKLVHEIKNNDTSEFGHHIFV
jgi:hypothetical protein